MTVVKSDIHDLHCRHVHNSRPLSLKAIISNVLQLFEFIRNNQFWFLNYFRIRESLVLDLWKYQNQRTAHPFYIKKTLKKAVFMKELATNWWFYDWLINFFKKQWELWLHTRTGSLIFWEPWLWILRTALKTSGGLFICSCFLTCPDNVLGSVPVSNNHSDNLQGSVPASNKHPILVTSFLSTCICVLYVEDA
jgi:hypothetical protein